MITIFKVSTISNKHVWIVLLIFLCLWFHTQVPVWLLLLHLPVDWQVSLRLHSCPAPRTTLQRGPVRRRFGHSCVCHVEAANRSEVFLIHCSIWIYIVFCVLPKTLKQLCIIIFICNILFPNYIYFKFVICNSRLKLISLTKIENQIEKELCHTVAKPNFCCVNSVQCIWIAYPREFFILRNIVKKEGNFPFKSYGAFSMIFNDILKSFSVCH